MKNFVCSENKIRLDKFLVIKLKNLSRSKIQHLIINGQVQVNTEIVNQKHYWLNKGDKVKVSLDTLVQVKKEKSSLEKQIKIIIETKDYLVIEKPAGLIVHGTKEILEYSLVDFLIKKYPQIKKVGDDLEFRPGIVHRLDKKVSGLMLIALNQKSFQSLKTQFKKHTVIKKYFALVYGGLKDFSGIIDFPIERSRRSGKMVAKPKYLNAKEALTFWEVKKRFNHYTLLDVQIKTGRNHQIRAHLQAIHHPIVGDNLYRIKKYKDKFNLQRVFLHAHYLEFTDLNGQRQIFESKLPKVLQNLIKKL